ncbi:antitoxin YokJ [Nonomuraea sp. TT08I-71]|nr:antitoxin YokJ [Nonomuraea sp. TT08I-71]
MSRIDDLVDALRRDATCTLAQPVRGTEHAFSGLPDDLRRFYNICGGAVLFVGAPFVWEIVGPQALAPTNPEVVGEQVDDDLTSSWFIVGRQRGDSSALISIDLAANRLGWCYDSDVEIHGLVGSCPILAFSFTELLEELIDARGRFIFWEGEKFVYKGDAYDPIDNSTQ